LARARDPISEAIIMSQLRDENLIKNTEIGISDHDQIIELKRINIILEFRLDVLEKMLGVKP